MLWKGKNAEIKVKLHYLSWAYGKKPYDCHQFIDGVLPKECKPVKFAHCYCCEKKALQKILWRRLMVGFFYFMALFKAKYQEVLLWQYLKEPVLQLLHRLKKTWK
jgi:hypothetical protein